MIDIYCDGGAYHGCMIEFDVLKETLKNENTKNFIEFEFQDGAKGAVRIGSINGFCESEAKTI